MNIIPRLLAAACVCAGIHALAQTPAPISPTATADTQPPSSSAPSPSEATAPNPNQAHPAAPEPRKVTRIILRDDTISDAELKQIISAHYRPEKRADGVRYCRLEAPMGTRFQKKMCRTGREIIDDQIYAKELMETAIRAHKNLRDR